jgi:RNA recognition motif-containing protein
MNGKSKGFAFVVFENASEAQSAVEKFRDGSIKGRRFSIEISKPREGRTTTTIRRESVVSGSAGSPAPSSAAAVMSPEVEDPKTNGTEVAEESKEDQETQQPIKDTRERERTMALMNVPDTVSAARIEKLLEPYGAIKKLTVRADHAGAVVEFAEESSIGKASLGLDGTEFEGSVIRTSKVSDLLKQKPFQRELRIDQKKKEAPKKVSNANPFANAMIRRPGEQRRGAGRGRGGRGGLGAQSRGLARREATAASSDGVAKAGMKTNADFRALLLGGKRGAHDGDSKEEANETKQAEKPKEKPMDDLMDDLMGGSDDEEDDLEEANGDTEDDDDEMED